MNSGSKDVLKYKVCRVDWECFFFFFRQKCVFQNPSARSAAQTSARSAAQTSARSAAQTSARSAARTSARSAARTV